MALAGIGPQAKPVVDSGSYHGGDVPPDAVDHRAVAARHPGIMAYLFATQGLAAMLGLAKLIGLMCRPRNRDRDLLRDTGRDGRPPPRGPQAHTGTAALGIHHPLVGGDAASAHEDPPGDGDPQQNRLGGIAARLQLQPRRLNPVPGARRHLHGRGLQRRARLVGIADDSRHRADRQQGGCQHPVGLLGNPGDGS